MILDRLDISLNHWGDHEGQYTGKAVFDDPKGEIKLNLTPENCQDILKICANGLIQHTEVCVNALRNNIILSIEDESSPS